MFRKPFKVKSNTQMKGCDKKKLKQDLTRSFPILSAENLDQIVPAKDDLHQVKIIVSSGEIVHLYTVEKQPIIFSRGNKMYPTVYLLWRYPQIIPYITTAQEVVPVLQNGADFMSAGIISPYEDTRKYGNFSKNDTVFINVTNNKASVAVGEIALSSDDMYMSAGRGKCVKVLHTFEDELCKFGVAIPLPQLGPVFEDPSSQESDVDTSENVSYAVAAKSTEESTPESALKRLTIEENHDTKEELVSEEDILKYCFLKALNTSSKNIKLPVLISNFYKVHMIPCCPDDRTVDVKKTKYKKMSNFMREMANDNLIKIEESSPGVQSITQINYSHYLVSGFVDPHPSGNSVKEEKTDEPKVSETYSVTAAVLPLFSEFLIKKGESLSVSEVRKYTAEYIRKYKLPLPDDPSMVKLDPVLKNILYQNNVDESAEVAKWEEIMNKVLSKMSRSFKIVNSNAVFAQKEQKGKLPLIDIRIANKSGNKKVTLINNLEAYGINMEEFSRECQKGVAASATINQINGLKSSQLQIQGNQINFIEKILTGKYNIPRKYMNGLQFAPKKK